MMAQTKITSRTRSLGLAHTTHPARPMPSEPRTVGTFRQILDELAELRGRYGSAEQPHGGAGIWWRAALFYKGQPIAESARDVLRELERDGETLITLPTREDS